MPTGIERAEQLRIRLEAICNNYSYIYVFFGMSFDGGFALWKADSDEASNRLCAQIQDAFTHQPELMKVFKQIISNVEANGKKENKKA
jgi:hypothetical protein